MADALIPEPVAAGRGGRTTAAGGRRLTADARRRQLFDVALALFAEHGYAATTMDDIAEAAGVTKPLVYQHFESKRALYLELMDVFSRELVTDIVKATADAQGPRQQVELGFAAYFELMLGNEQAFRLLYGRDAPDDPELGEALRRVEETLARAIDSLIDAGLDPEHRLLLAHAVVGMAEGPAATGWTPAEKGAAASNPSGGPSSGRPSGRRGQPPRHPTGRLRLGWAAPGPPHLSQRHHLLGTVRVGPDPTRRPDPRGPRRHRVGVPPNADRAPDEPATGQAVTWPATTGWLVLWTTPPACSAVMAKAWTEPSPATLKGTTAGSGPSSPSEMVLPPITPHSW